MKPLWHHALLFSAAIFLSSCGDGKSGHSVRLTDSILLDLVEIPAGKFTMGSPKSEEWRDDDEEQSGATISQSFFLGTTEVTIEAFLEFLNGVAPSEFQDEWLSFPDNPDSFFVRSESGSFSVRSEFRKGLGNDVKNRLLRFLGTARRRFAIG